MKNEFFSQLRPILCEWESECGGNIIIMYVRGNMRPVETVPGMGCVIVKENNGLGEFQHDALQEFLNMSHCICSTTIC
jgi:hypothetical protein